MINWYAPFSPFTQCEYISIINLKVPCLGIIVCRIFTIWHTLWPKMTFDLHLTTGVMYSMHYTYKPNMRSVQASLLEISYLQGFHHLTCVDPKWPLTSTKNNRLLVLNRVHLHTKYEICPSFPSWAIVFTRFSQFYLCWPQMTFDLHQKQ